MNQQSWLQRVTSVLLQYRKGWLVPPPPLGWYLAEMFCRETSRWHFGSAFASYIAVWSQQHCIPLEDGKGREREGSLVFFFFKSLWAGFFMWCSPYGIHPQGSSKPRALPWLLAAWTAKSVWAGHTVLHRSQVLPLTCPNAWAPPQTPPFLISTQGTWSGRKTTMSSPRSGVAWQERQWYSIHISLNHQERQIPH